MIIAILGIGAAWAANRFRKPPEPDIAKLSTAALQERAARRPSVASLGTLCQRFLKSGDLKSASDQASKLVSLYPRDARSHNALGAVLAAQGRAEDARREFNTAIALDPRRIDPYVNLGRLAARTGDDSQARIEYDRATAVDPSSASAWLGLGDACRDLGEREAAKQAYERAVQLAPKDGKTLTALGTFEAESGSGAAAKANLLKALQSGYRTGDLFAALTMALADQPESNGDLTTALEYADEAEKLGDHSSMLLYAKGLALQRLGRYKDAIPVFRNAISVSPNANGPWIGISQCYRGLGEMKLAEEAASIGERILDQRQRLGNLERQIQTNPDRMDLREQYAAIMMNNHQYLLAAESYRYIAQHRSDKPQLWLRVAKAFELGGRPELARSFREQIQTLRPRTRNPRSGAQISTASKER
jgi:Flp pilus assembly protein TadD